MVARENLLKEAFKMAGLTTGENRGRIIKKWETGDQGCIVEVMRPRSVWSPEKPGTQFFLFCQSPENPNEFNLVKPLYCGDQKAFFTYKCALRSYYRFADNAFAKRIAIAKEDAIEHRLAVIEKALSKAGLADAKVTKNKGEIIVN